MKKKNFFISIITPVYNDRKALEYSFSSIINLPNFIECIIVDGGSIDGSLEYALELKDKIGVNVINQNSKGIFAALNEGLKYSKGEYVLAFFCGDKLKLDKLLSSDILKSNFDILAYSCTQTDNKNNLHYYIRSQRKPITIHSTSILHPSLLIKIEAIKNVNYFDTNFPVSADIDLMIKLISKGCKIIYSDDIIVEMAPWGNSEKKKFSKILEHTSMKKRINGTFYSLIYLLYRIFLTYFVFPIRNKIKLMRNINFK